MTTRRPRRVPASKPRRQSCKAADPAAAHREPFRRTHDKLTEMRVCTTPINYESISLSIAIASFLASVAAALIARSSLSQAKQFAEIPSTASKRCTTPPRVRRSFKKTGITGCSLSGKFMP